jgi:protein-disulfide isomerase
MTRDFDALLKEVIKENYENITCPPKDEMWKQLEDKISDDGKERIFIVLRIYTRVKVLLKRVFNSIIEKDM